jgi:hypothetical protein
MSNASRRAVLTGTAAAAVALSASVPPTIALAADGPDPALVALNRLRRSEAAPSALQSLWNERERINAQIKIAAKRMDSAEALIPAWARPGPKYVNTNGERVGTKIGWPEREDADEAIEKFKQRHPNGGSVFLTIRPSLYSLREALPHQLALYRGNARSQFRLNYLASLRRIRARVKQRDAEYEKAGYPQLEKELLRLYDCRQDVNDKIGALPPSVDTIAAIVFIEKEELCEDLSDQILNHVAGDITFPILRERAAAILKDSAEEDAA